MNQLHCDAACEWIVRYLDEGLDSDQRSVLESHLRECPDCRRFKDETDQLLSLLPEHGSPEPDEQFWNDYHSSLHARLEEKAASRRPFWGFGWKVFGTAACAAVVFFIVFLQPSFHSEPSSQWYDSVKASSIMSEFSEVYGPGPEEIALTTMSPNESSIAIDTRVRLAGPDLMTWYDLDDETNAYSF